MLQDLRYAARSLGRAPAFSVTAVSTLALGIGASTAIFGLAWAIWLKPMPYEHPEQLVRLYDMYRGAGGGGVSAPEVHHLRRDVRSFSDVAGYAYGAGITFLDGEPARISAYQVPPNLFTMLGVTPALGRGFDQGDVDNRDGPVIILSDAFWRRRLHADPSAVGRSFDMNGQSYTIVGVMPRDFSFPITSPSDMWQPLRGWGASYEDRSQRYVQAIARLRPDVSVDAARVDVGTLTTRLAATYPATNDGWTMAVTPLMDQVMGGYREAFGALLTAVGVLLLVACVNIAGVFLARNATRRHELAVRAALGAGRWRVAAQGLSESMLLAVMGGGAGLALAGAGTSVLSTLMPRYTPRIAEVRVDLPVFVFAALAAALCGVLCGLFPSLRDAEVGPGDALRSQRSRSVAGTRSHRLQSGLVVAEVALSIVLLVGGGLMVRSLSALLGRTHGFDPHGVLTLHVTMPFDGRYDGQEPRAQGFRAVLAAIAALPGVEAVAEVTGFPDSSLGYLGNVSVNADPADPDARVLAALRAASADYFRVMGIPVLTGRSFHDRGGATGPTQVVMSQALAKRLWPEKDAVGRHFSIPEAGPVADMGDAVVVGVVGDVRMGATPDPDLYVPLNRSAAFWADVVVRTTGNPAALAGAVRGAVRALDDHILIEDMQPMDVVMADRLALQRAQSFAVGLFAVLTLLLAAVGLYGLVSWLVGQRTREMGVRMALGASRADVFVAVARRGLGLAAGGVAGGIALALGAIHVLRAKVFGLDHVDPWAVAAAATLLMGVAFAACWLPARRATRLDPVTALR